MSVPSKSLPHRRVPYGRRTRQIAWPIYTTLVCLLVVTACYKCASFAIEWLATHPGELAPSILLSRRDLANSKLAIVVPFTARDVSDVHANLGLWRNLGSACSTATATRTDIWFYFNKNATDLPESFIDMRETSPEYRDLDTCFGLKVLAFAGLTNSQDTYPGGINLMFFKLILGEGYQKQLAGYHAVFWMEPDVMPIKPYWVDTILNESIDGDFWIKGSPYLGDLLDASAGRDRDWVGHINGNALYRLHDPDFATFLRIVMDREPPEHYWKPFDVSIWKVLQDFPYSWHMHPRIARRFVYSEYIHHWSFQLEEYDMSISKSSNKTFLVHGKKSSAGTNNFVKKFPADKKHSAAHINWNGAIEGSDKVSVLLRASARELEYAEVSIASILRHMPGATEIVVAVPADDLTLIQNRFQRSIPASSSVNIVREMPVYEDHDTDYGGDAHSEAVAANIQDAYTRMLADVYCPKGEYVLLMRTDTVLTRRLYRKDLFFAGKPVVPYDNYSNQPVAASLWQEGVSAALRSAAIDKAFVASSTHAYPKASFSQARLHIQKAHGLSFREFMQTRAGALACLREACPGISGRMAPDQLRKLAFSTSAYLGAYIWAFDHASVSWIPLDQAEYHRQTFVPIIPKFTCQGSPWLARQTGRQGADVHALYNAAIDGKCETAVKAEDAKDLVHQLYVPAQRVNK